MRLTDTQIDALAAIGFYGEKGLSESDLTDFRIHVATKWSLARHGLIERRIGASGFRITLAGQQWLKRRHERLNPPPFPKENST